MREPRVPEAAISRLVAEVLRADEALKRQPIVMRQLADERTAAVRRLVDALGGNVREAARRLEWPAPSLYRIRNGKFARTSARKGP